jgi:hypothetical protein
MLNLWIPNSNKLRAMLKIWINYQLPPLSPFYLFLLMRWGCCLLFRRHSLVWGITFVALNSH